MDSRKHVKTQPAGRPKKAEIFIVRHATAMDREEFAKVFKKDDRFRPLTEKGKKEFKKIAKEFAKKPKIKKLAKKEKLTLLYSPYKRAKQTAKILEKRLNIKGRPLADLEHDKRIDNLVEFIDKKVLHTKKPQSYIFVGHEPDLSALFEKISDKPLAEFKKGEVRHLVYSFDRHRFGVDWRILPTVKVKK